MVRRRRLIIPGLLALTLAAGAGAQQVSAPVRGGADSIVQRDLKEWLTYLSSDQLQGRATYSEGLGLAAGYIASHLEQWGVTPAGDNGTYLQTVKVQGVRTDSEAAVTVTVNGQSRMFEDGEGITFPRQMGGRQRITAGDILFAGYGLDLPAAKGQVVVYIGARGPAALPPGSNRLLAARGRTAIDQGALAVIGPAPAAGARGRSAAASSANVTSADFTTVARYDALVPPRLTAEDEFFEFLFSGSDVPYAELKAKAAAGEPLPPVSLQNVSMTIDVNATYHIVRTRLTHNVVGIVEGTDPTLKDTYVAYGAHYDHTGFRESGKPGEDLINNGADDDGSGTVAIMAIARAFALGPKPKRSLLFVWHAGEENGLLGSRYMADHPVVGDIAKIVTQLNMDMVGRNENDDPANANTVFVVGADRISTQLHNINEAANAALSKPLTLDYALNDPADPQSIYTRSDHYSYASKGIPIVFYFTGLHGDYHRPTDTVDKIVFDKVQRVAQLAYETGRRVASLDIAPVKDNRGPRAGRGFSGTLPVDRSR